jgi:flagellar basal body P-ring protein FlgI
MDDSVAEVTLSVELPVFSVTGSVAVIVVVPTTIGVAKPLEPTALLMVATAMVEELQVTAVVKGLVDLSV